MATTHLGAAETTHRANQLQKGAELECKRCGMKLKVTADCGCNSGVHLECCGQPLSAVGAPTPPPPSEAQMS
jgi:hypothetical protein